MNTLRLDVRDAWRALRRTPGAAIVAAVTLGLGVAATTAVYGVVYGILLKPVAGMRADGVFVVDQRNQRLQWAALLESDFRALASEPVGDAAAIDAVTEVGFVTIGRIPGRADELSFQGISGGVAADLDLHTQAGRWIDAGDDHARGTGTVAVISDRLWRGWFGGATSAVGARLRLGDTAFHIVGVASRDFVGMRGGLAPTDVWVPLAQFPLAIGRSSQSIVTPDRFRVTGLVRPRPGARADRLADALSARQANLTHGAIARVMLSPVPPSPNADSAASPALYLAIALSGLVLAGACANVANLLYARFSTRAGDMAVRLSLGATRGRLLRLYVVEVLAIAGLGSLAGVGVAVAAVRAFGTSLSNASNAIGTRFAFDLHLDLRGMLLGIGAGLATGVCAGLFAAWQSTPTQTSRALAATSGTTTALTPTARRVRMALVAVQVTAAVALLMSTGLIFGRTRDTTDHALHIRYDAARLVVGQFRLAADGYTETQGRVLYDRVAQAVRHLPDVQQAAIVDVLPGEQNPMRASAPTVLLTEDSQRDVARAHARHANAGLMAGTPGLFDTLGLRILRGRGFQASDGDGAPLVAVVSQSTAAALWPSADPIGRSLRIGGDQRPWLTVVGVVDDPVRGARDSRDDETSEDIAARRPSNAVFVPLAQHYSDRALVLVRSDRPAAQIEALRAAVRDVDPNVALLDVALASQRLDAFGPYRPIAAIVISLGVAALAIAVLGVYGVVSYFVSTRTREIGIRMALGATRLGVLKMVLDYALHIMLVGLLPGVFVASVGSRILEARVYRLMPNEISTWVIVPLLILAAGVLAGLVPASRAARVDPNVALKEL